ncbi:serine/threonine protein phosphatase, partial [Alistipes onderdonkii]
MNRFEALMRRAALVLALLLTTACGGGEEEPRTPPAEPPREIEVDASSTLYGFVGDTAGNPVEGVVVSDGFQCVATDAGGVYEMKRNAAAEYVYYSVPAEFKIRTGHDGYPDFYVRLDTSQQKIRQDFTLERLAGVERSFRLICIGDPQINEASHAVRFKEEAGREIREYAASAGVPCYGITLGDHVNNKWTLFTNMVVALQPEQTGVPVFATIGNHDHEFPTADEKAARAKYESYFGPVDYSFNRGDVHVVSMDNVIHSSKASADYEGGFTAAQYAWLKQDLSFVPKDKMVILCVHIPFRGGWGTNSAHADADKYYDEVLDLLSQYEYAAIMSAHTHSNIN